jgi:23S rRNA (guanosine2251-2'-O)-methyltransferase
MIEKDNRPMRRQRPRPDKPASHAWRGKQRHATRRDDDSDRVVLFGLHAVEAALANPRRHIGRLFATENAAQRLSPLLAKRRVKPEPTSPKDLDRLLGPDAVHQGVALETEPLPPMGLDDVSPDGILLVLDQVTDPQNVGAALRSAAVFGASGLVLTERHSPPLHGVLAKAASGALDIVPVILVKNLAQSLSELGERSFLRVGLAEEASEALETAPLTRPLALVLGAEGKGLRQLTREHCDRLCRISTENAFASLNVSNAAAVALHWASLKTKG